eukprot:gene31679-38284_t
MTSKARFNQPSGSSSSTIKPTNPRAAVGASGHVAGSKRASQAPVENAGAGGAGKSGKIQVIFNGKIVTPQSLIPRKPAGHRGDQLGRKPKGVSKQPQTIDEGSSDADSKSLQMGTKLSGKKLDPGSDNRMAASKFSLAFKKGAQQVEESVTVLLDETSTCMLLHIPSHVVASDTRDVMVTDEKNARYEAVIKGRKNVDGYTARPSQTKNNLLKNKNETAAPPAYKESGTMAVSYEIADETAVRSDGQADGADWGALGVGTG